MDVLVLSAYGICAVAVGFVLGVFVTRKKQEAAPAPEVVGVVMPSKEDFKETLEFIDESIGEPVEQVDVKEEDVRDVLD